MAFTDDDIGVVVRTGRLSDAEAEQYLIERLIERRDKIGRYWFSLVNTLGNFEVTPNGMLAFERLATTFDLSELSPDSGITWFEYDNRIGKSTAISEEATYGANPIALPESIRRTIDCVRAQFREDERTISVYMRRVEGEFRIEGTLVGDLR